MATIDLRKCGELPIIKHPSSASADCKDLENNLVKGGTTASWTIPDIPVINPPDPYWVDEETEQYITLESGELIEMA